MYLEKQRQPSCTLDLRSGFWHIGLDPSTKHKAAFISRNGIYEWKRMPFGLMNAPISFQTLLAHVLRGLNFKTCLVYVDDILVFSPDLKTHLQHLNQVFGRLREANLKLNPNKCSIATKQVKYLGHI